MVNLSFTEIRDKFLKFFQERGHQIVPSAPIVVKNDPTLMFTNAGMNQFKDLFLGNAPIQYHRVADTQKCLRVSGKHNDLEEVGVDTYHHTMFEMLGNWSFGDPENPEAGYFKKEAIAWSWELLHNEFKIPADRLYATIFEGDPSQGIPKDEEAYQEWLKYLPAEQILLGSKKDNFWEMGDTGPCGPCTEIHVDCRTLDERAEVPGADLVNNDHPQVIEIWNNVFIQFNRLKDGSLESLPARHVDTGMGFERLVRVLQGKMSNYDTDIFAETIIKISEITDFTYRGKDDKSDVAFRVIADHIRAICFTISDGQLPSNTGAGYVIRRILRRAIRYYYSFLNYKQPLLTQLVPVLALQYKNVFPELYQQMSFVQKVILEEENAFLRTLEAGIKRFEAYAEEGEKVISGSKIFELMDTFGFPLDLSRLMAQERNLQIDEQGFDHELQAQKDRSRASSKIETDDWVVIHEGNQSTFVGYDFLISDTKILKYRKVTQKDQSFYQIVLQETPFYAESGGQVGDSGSLTAGNEIVNVFNTKKENDLIIHFTDSLFSDPSLNIQAKVDVTRRQKIMLNHTATHLLHSALRSVLGGHVTQKGSLVNDQYLRFDFSHFSKVNPNEIKKIELLVQSKIRENIPVVIKTMPKEEALQLGAMALFGEKYGDLVRVVTIDPNYSVELCGGTHVMHTGEIGYFKITSESAVAAGVRRVEALTGANASEYSEALINKLQKIADQLGNPKDVESKLTDLLNENRRMGKLIESYELERVAILQDQLIANKRVTGDKEIIIAKTQINDSKHLKTLGFNLSKMLKNGIVILGNVSDDKAQLQINIDQSLTENNIISAVEMVKRTAHLIGGGGGGQATYATAGGKLIGGVDAALEQLSKEFEA